VYGLGWFPIHHLLYFARIYGYGIHGNSVPQEFHTIQPELPFGEFSIELMISQMLKNCLKMFSMFFLNFGIDQKMKTTKNLSSSVIKIEFMRYMK
jgi:hypothetical protein